jgi:hypothetical protein
MDVARGDDRMDDSGSVNAKHFVDEREVARTAPMQKNFMMGLNVREDRWRVDWVFYLTATCCEIGNCVLSPGTPPTLRW